MMDIDFCKFQDLVFNALYFISKRVFFIDRFYQISSQSVIFLNPNTSKSKKY